MKNLALTAFDIWREILLGAKFKWFQHLWTTLTVFLQKNWQSWVRKGCTCTKEVRMNPKWLKKSIRKCRTSNILRLDPVQLIENYIPVNENLFYRFFCDTENLDLRKSMAFCIFWCKLTSDGRVETVMFDKITSRISKLCYHLNPDFVDPVSSCR